MTFQDTELVFDEEIERLRERRAEVAVEVSELPDGSDRAVALRQVNQELEARLAGVLWARDTAHKPEDEGGVSVWDADVDAVTLGGLTGGEYGRLQDDLEYDVDGLAGNGAARVYQVARGTVAAPYLTDSEGSAREGDALVGAVSQLPITYLKWAEAQIEERTTLGGNGLQPFESLQPSGSQETSTET